MTANEARKFKVGTRVKWADGALGTVRETSYAAVKIEWDDAQWLLLPFADDRAPWQNLSVSEIPRKEKRA